ncbi:MAG TPA: hypothetical protein VH854_02710 [Thermoanaerobaculia bacterium]|jgi:hypothetical protein|nr:hypothetical protein [Thermoanaerobaculia bacterium]
MRRGRDGAAGTALAAAAVLLLTLASSPLEAQTYHLRPERARRALDVTVSAGDLVRIVAGGCFRRPAGAAEPLLQPGRASAQALVFIPGVTLSFQPVADLVGRDLAVAAPLETPGAAHVWIDWGPFPRSRYESADAESPPLPCTTPNREPFLDVTIRRGAAAASDHGAPGSLTLELNRYDRNMLPLDPDWIGRVRPDVCDACGGFRIEKLADGGKGIALLRSPRCTLQRPSVDASEGLLCPGRRCSAPGRGPTIGGHVNWGPAAFTGRVSTPWDESGHVNRDGDLELVLESDGKAGTIAPSPPDRYDARIELEFESGRTARWFRTPFWKQLLFRKDSFAIAASYFGTVRRHPSAKGPVPVLRDAPASAIGLFGIDNLHEVHTELHPLYAIAIQVEASPARQRWVAFARRGGMEGECGSRLEHTIDAKQLVLPLGAAAGAWTRVSGEFFDHGLPVADWRIHAGSGSGSGSGAPSLVIPLPDKPCTVVEGEITLERGAGTGAPLAAGEPPVSEPLLWNAAPRPEEWCHEEDWFREVE